MKSKYRVRFLLSAWLTLSLCSGTQIVAQSKVGTTVGQFLKIEPSARIAALGSAGASMFGDAVTAYHNPASLGRLNGIQAQFTHSPWLADIKYNHLVVGIPLNTLGSIMMQITSLNSGEIDVRTVEQPLGTGERYDVTNFALGIAYGLKLTDRVSVGLQANYFQESIWNSSLSGLALNFGVQYQLSERGPMLGASLLNFGPRSGYNGRDLFLDYDFNPDKFGDNDQLPAELRTDQFPLPTTFRVGIAYPLNFGENNSFLLAVEATHPTDNYESLNFGAEWKFFGSFSLRGGYHNVFLDDSEGGLTLGSGLEVKLMDYQFGFDYSWADYGILNQAQRFTLGFRF